MTDSDTDETDGEELAQDINGTIEALLAEIDFADPDETPDMGMGGLMAVDPEMLVSQMWPMFAGQIEDRPSETIEAAAMLSLELEALVRKHAGETPSDVLAGE